MGVCFLCGDEREVYVTIYPLKGWFCAHCISQWPEPLSVLFDFAHEVGSPLAADTPA